MTEKLLTGTLSLITNKQNNEIRLFMFFIVFNVNIIMFPVLLTPVLRPTLVTGSVIAMRDIQAIDVKGINILTHMIIKVRVFFVLFLTLP